MAKSFYVYILKCSDNTYYTGITNNIERRLLEHNKGKEVNSYTFKRRPLQLVFHTEFSNVEVAIEMEKKVKKWSKKKKEALINNDFELLPPLSKKKF